METIIDRLSRHVDADPGRCLFTFCDAHGQETAHTTYAGFDARTRALAERLLAEGIRRGDRVLLVHPPGLEPVAALVACVRAGIVPVPVCPPSAAAHETGLRRLEAIARDCGAGCALTTSGFLSAHAPDRDPRLPLRWLPTDSGPGAPSSSFRDAPGPLVLLQYTSGSTRHPAGVMVSHANVLANGAATLDFVPTCVSWLPQYHDMGLIGYYLFPMIVGGTTHGFAPFDFLRQPALWLRRITAVGATHTGAPNFGFAYCLRRDKLPDEALEGVDLSSLRIMMNAAEPVRPKTQSDFLERFAAWGLRREALIAAYGLAENTITVSQRGRVAVHVNTKLLQEGLLHVEPERAGGRNQLAIASCGGAVDGVEIAIAHPGTHRRLGEDRIGEIWTSGPSRAEGYWGRPEETERVFSAALAGEDTGVARFLRTGDLGFLHDGELYVCGRLKDVIIVRGVNCYPQDVEAIAEAASQKIRPNGVAAIEAGDYGGELVVLIEPRKASDLPDPAAVAAAIRTRYHVHPSVIAFVAHGALPRTTSGKLARGIARRLHLDGRLETIASHAVGAPASAPPGARGRSRFRHVLELHGLTGEEDLPLSEVGIDSLTMAEILTAIHAVLAARGADATGGEIDARALSRLSVSEFCSLADRIDGDDPLAAAEGWERLARRSGEQVRDDAARMRADCDRLSRAEPARSPSRAAGPTRSALLTGATGFLGPFLIRSLLDRASWRIQTLIRADDAEHAERRLRAALARAGLAETAREIGRRILVVPGDLARPGLGLQDAVWRALAAGTDAIVHNGAHVDYVLGYEALRPHNVLGTRTLIRLAEEGCPKRFHHVSSTFIFGWTTKAVLLETDGNEAMEQLDFGYAQTKWVAERMVMGARARGLDARIYRPSLISAASSGAGSASDIATRLLAFMITHGLAPDAANQVSFLPADRAADTLARIMADPDLPARSYHVTVDDYYAMTDVAREITRAYGYEFDTLPLPRFVAEMAARATKQDPIFPLVPFFQRSHAKIAAMRHKRYDNAGYRQARLLTGGGEDPALASTVSYLVTFLLREGLIPLPLPSRSGREAVGRVEPGVGGGRHRGERESARAPEGGIDVAGRPVGT